MVSAIVLSYNRCSEVLYTISRLKTYREYLPFDLEIIVIDNASIDDTSFFIKEEHPDVKLITKKTNNGIAGWNEGFKIALYKYFLVLDDDSCIQSGLLDAVVKLEQDKDIGILALNIVDNELNGDPNLNPEDAWKDGENIVGFIGCGALITKKLYETIGGYSEWIYVYTHEFDYGIRALNAGFKVKFFKDGVVVHRTSKINRSNKRMRIFAVRNELTIVHKYFKSQRLLFMWRVFINNLKFIKREGLMSGYYILLGGLKFLQIRKSIKRTPISQKVQTFFAANFWSTKPVIHHHP